MHQQALAAAAATMLLATSAAAQTPMNISGLPGQRATPLRPITQAVTFYCNWGEAGEAQMALAESQAEEAPDAQYCYGFADIDRSVGDEIIRVNVNFQTCDEMGCPFEIFTINGNRWHLALIQGPNFERLPQPRTFAQSMSVEYRGLGFSTLIVGTQRIEFSRVMNTGASAFEAH